MSLFIDGGQCALAYYSEIPVVIDRFGLTDVTIAHQPLARRGRPGHEKQARLDYLVRRRVTFAASGPRREYNQIRIGPHRLNILTYDEALMAQLRARPGVRFIDFPSYLSRYVRTLSERPTEEVWRGYVAFRSYYFTHHPRPDVQRRILDHLRQRGFPVPPHAWRELERARGDR